MPEVAELHIEGLVDFREIGAGGFSTVYAAREVGFGREVAVKVLRALDANDQRRFDRERGLMGRLGDHPNVVTPHRYGITATGAPYLVMEYLPGGSLATLIKQRGGLEWDEAVALLLPIADAIGRAHAEGIAHRDVKPANILLTADGTPKLTDFGIAGIGESTATHVAYTLAHVAPETFSQGRDDRDERSDFYSLGSTLFAAVTGGAPFGTEGPDSEPAYMARICNNPVPSVDGVPAHDGLIRRLLAKNPDERPATAHELIALLRASIVADADAITPPAQAAPTQARPRVLATTPVAYERPPDAAPTPPRSRSRSRSRLPAVAITAAAFALFVTVVTMAQREVDRRTDLATIPTLVGAIDPQATEVTASEVPESALAPPVVFTDHGAEVLAVVALDDGRVASAGADGALRVWHPDDGSIEQVVFEEDHTAGVWSLAVLPDGRIVSGGADDSTVRVWDTATAAAEPVIYDGHAGAVSAVAVLADGRVASAGDDGDASIHIWDPDDASAAVVLTEPGLVVDALLGLADGRLASAGSDGTIRVWDLADPGAGAVAFGSRLSGDARPPRYGPNSLDQLADGRLVAGSLDEVVRVIDPADLARGGTEFANTGIVLAVAVLDDGRIAAAGDDGKVRLWMPDGFAGIKVFAGHEAATTALAVLANGRVASGSSDGTVVVWGPAVSATG